MEILFYMDIILGFVSQKLNKKHLKQINQIIDNENNIFLYNKKFFQLLENKVLDENKLFFNSFITKISDNQKSKNIKSSDSANFDDEFIHIYENSENVVLKFAYNDLIIKVIPNIAIISKQEKPNFNWLVVDLAIANPRKVSLKYSDFKSNKEITELFENIFKIPKKINEVYIFDAFCNLQHNIYNFIIQKKININYYTKSDTTNYKSKEIDQQERFEKIKQKFEKKAKIFFTQPKNVHGRRILFENFIITSDNDFQNLLINSSDWNLDIQYSVIDSNDWLKRINLYHEFVKK